jgi:hypothetical protein
VEQDGHALRYANSSLQDNHEIVLAAVERAGGAVQYASEELQHNHSIVLAAVRQDCCALNAYCSGFKDDPEIKHAAKNCGGCLGYKMMDGMRLEDF